jgi:hypothetical protein
VCVSAGLASEESSQQSAQMNNAHRLLYAAREYESRDSSVPLVFDSVLQGGGLMGVPAGTPAPVWPPEGSLVKRLSQLGVDGGEGDSDSTNSQKYSLY